MKRLVLWFVFIGIFMVMFIGFLYAAVLGKTDGVTGEKPFLAAVDEIAVGAGYTYTLDNRFNNICKYDSNGNFIMSITYRDYGDARIFCNEAGQLCRVSIRGDRVYVYGNDGKISEQYDESHMELIDSGKLSWERVKSVTVNGIGHSLKNRFILNSYVLIGANKAITETFGFHLFGIMYIIIAAGCIILAVCNLIKYLFTHLNGNQRVKGRNPRNNI